MSTEYYIQRIPSGYIGNSPVWWEEGDSGYTSYITGARRFTQEEALGLVEKNPKKWKMFDCDYVDNRLNLVFDHQYANYPDSKPTGGFASNPNKEWKVGEFYSSSTPGTIVLMLAINKYEVNVWQNRDDFIRWVG